MEMTCRDRGSPPVRVVAVAPCLAPIERRNLAALQLLSFPSLLLEEIDKEKDPKGIRKDDVLPDGTQVKAGGMVTYVPYSMGRMEYDWGADAASFRPERWFQDGVLQNVSPFPSSSLPSRLGLGYVSLSILASLVEMKAKSPPGLRILFTHTGIRKSKTCEKRRVTAPQQILGRILGFSWITGSFEFRDLFQIVNTLIHNNGVNSLFATLCAFFFFVGAVAKSAQFPLHVWLPDAMEGPTPISALIHAATMVAAGIFLVARLLPLFIVIPDIMNLICLVCIITVLLGATLALAQRDIKRSLAYSTMSQLGYIMLALGIGSYRAAFFHLITHAYSKAFLFLVQR
ncbi:hypothetical protein IEQ34_025684 [Dendrobium chrysotoxum]|uniref:NADH:quinone oxidoreductase/Mrp antiporter transmembrane domain-containing protein n=1 Tax=Dendrobium chrysotoxum TaxID=161865 RepID=A0AAV7FIX8_DENCH|nr:hypothetical protein IEQ34_025684 [Dendrobium chrysotoxum]